ncbi:hypothetical protein NH340_JMT02556 [Sarcoptes scabiei]|nr:hypothetical protein NH340_JMT02556 [Sarcoptes scabiei]
MFLFSFHLISQPSPSTTRTTIADRHHHHHRSVCPNIIPQQFAFASLSRLDFFFSSFESRKNTIPNTPRSTTSMLSASLISLEQRNFHQNDSSIECCDLFCEDSVQAKEKMFFYFTCIFT